MVACVHAASGLTSRPAGAAARADSRPMIGEVRVVDDVPVAFAELVLDEAPESIALSGGSLARRCYEELAVRDVDWRTVTVFIGDERVVPVDDDESNEGMARRVLLDGASPAII